MIALVDVSHYLNGRDGSHALLSGVSQIFAQGHKIGILAAAGSGKSAFARLLSGIDQPDRGDILREGKISGPLGFAGGFHGDLTVSENIQILAELTGQPAGRILAFCQAFANLGHCFGKLMKDLAPETRARLAFVVSISQDFDTYIVDECIGVGDVALRKKCDAFLTQRLKNAGLIFISKNPAQLQKYCSQYFLLVAGKLAVCKNLTAGEKALNRYQRSRIMFAKGA